MQQSHNLF